ncbi:tRNA lysidine(34) synthetase TilS [Shivajiella indica]|uniref:tRNA(Ile)-lysidine synthase n=1 Tax=Shivajiella indica TaxID=872115 RepID=A0ABW5B815_9BACT
MVNDFIKHIREKNILDESSKYLLALSGGLDSVTLGHLLIESGIDFEIAHVNYGLRAEESDGDEDFVRNQAIVWGKQIHIKRVPKSAFQQEPGSIQMIARKIRYDWFEELLLQENLKGVIVAHNFEDQVETILLNLLRGTGIEGVYGMSEKRGYIIRPLLPFHRRQIKSYLESKGINWREDSSNEKIDYKRNFLRNEILPLLEEKFPGGVTVMDQSFKRIKDSGKLLFSFFTDWKKKHLKIEQDYQSLKIQDFINLPGKHSLIYYWLRDFGFKFSDVGDIINSLESINSGKVFLSGKYILNIDREDLILGKIELDWSPVTINKGDIQISFPHGKFDILHVKDEFSLDRNPENAMLDMDKLSFPLLLRKWEEGDRIIPLGMKNEKKISDLLIDLKIPLIQKKKTALLISGDQVVWVLGHRISEKFKCDSNTRNVYYLKKNMS